jgi:hypothetical protein
MEPKPTALAHGRTTSSDIERVRRDVEKAEVKVAQDDQASAARRLRDHGVEAEPDEQA